MAAAPEPTGSPLLYQADLALSEAGSIAELKAARTSFAGNAELRERYGNAADDLLDKRMQERAQQLRQQDRSRVSNMLSSAPFHASNNATSPNLVDAGLGLNPDAGLGDRLNAPPGTVNPENDAYCATAPLPFDGIRWASYLESLAPQLKEFGPYLESYTNNVAKAIRETIAPVDDRRLAEQRAALEKKYGHAAVSQASPEADTGASLEDAYAPRRHIAIVGRRGVQRGSVFQALTSAGEITATAVVGAKMLPLALRHDDRAIMPYLPWFQVRRVWIPLRTVTEELRAGGTKPVVDLLASDSAAKNIHDKLANGGKPDDWVARGSQSVSGNQLTSLIRYAHSVLRAMAVVSRADSLLHEVFWSLKKPQPSSPKHDVARDGPLTGPPEIACRFPWLRGTSVAIALLDVPTPDNPSAFMPRTVESLLHRSITTVVVEEAKPSLAAPINPSPPPSNPSASGGDPRPPAFQQPQFGSSLSSSQHSQPQYPRPQYTQPQYPQPQPGSAHHDPAASGASSSQVSASAPSTKSPTPSGASTASPTAAGGGAQPAAAQPPVASMGPDALWQLLRKYSKARETEQLVAAQINADELATWDAHVPPPIIMVLTFSPATAHDSSSVDFAQLAIACHIRLRRRFQLSVNITNIFVVSPVAAGAVVQLFDNIRAVVESEYALDGATPPSSSPTVPVTRTSVSGSLSTEANDTDSDVNAVLSQLAQTDMLLQWQICLQRDPTGSEAPAKDLTDLLGRNETVWRMSAFGWLISALLQHVVADHVIPGAIVKLVRLQRSVDDLVHCCAERLLHPEVYANDNVTPYETRFVSTVRGAIGPLSGLLKQHLATVEEALSRWEDEAPKNPDLAESTSKPRGDTGNFFGAGVSSAIDQAQDRVQKTRLSLANIIRTKVAAVTALAPSTESGHKDRANAATATVGGQSDTRSLPAQLAVSAFDSIAKRAASALQGTTADVGLVAETLRAWWHHLSDMNRIGDASGDCITFKTVGDESALRLAFGVPELAEQFASDQNVIGNPTITLANNALRGLGSNPVLRAALAGKSARVARIIEWSRVSPPMPTAVISHTVTEHSALNATMPQAMRGGRTPCLLQVDAIEYQTHRELHKNLVAAGRYVKEALAVVIHFESTLENLAAAALIQRYDELGPGDIALPVTEERTCPVALAFTVFQALSAAIHGALAYHYHCLSATVQRPDDLVAHLGLGGGDDAPEILHCVGRLHEGRAEWRRWRVTLHRECALAAADVVDVTYAIALRNFKESMIPPLICSPDDLEKSREGSPHSAAPGFSPGGGSNASVPKRLGPKSRVGTRALPALVVGSHPGDAARVKGDPSKNPPRPSRLAAHVVANRKKAVLCLCGGGVRGVLTALFVQRLDSIVQAKYSVPGRRRLRLWDVVDEFYGTSTGAIVASLLSIGIEPSAIVNLYKNHSNQIFPPSSFNAVTAAAKPKYVPSGRLEVARRYMGRRVMNDQTIYAGIARPKVLVCDLSTLRTRVLTEEDDIHFVDALMAATAAPTFFPAYKIGATYYCDGGIAENHPGLQVAKDFRSVGYVATIGTGIAATNYQHLHNAGLMHWAPCFADVMIDSSQGACDEVLKAIFGENSELLNLTLPPVKMLLDDATTIPRLLEVANAYLEDNVDLFERVAEKLYQTTHATNNANLRLDDSTPQTPVA
jgi:hypothetical protein